MARKYWWSNSKWAGKQLFSGSLLTVYIPCLQKKLYTRSHSVVRTFSSPVSDVSIVEYCFCPAALWCQRHLILVACHSYGWCVMLLILPPMPLGIGCCICYYCFLSHTYGMGIDVCFHCPSHRNGWLPVFDASGIFHLPMSFLGTACCFLGTASFI